MFKIGFGLGDDCGNSFEALTQIRDALLGWGEIACHQQINAISETLIVNKRVPFPFLQLFETKDLVVDPILNRRSTLLAPVSCERPVNASSFCRVSFARANSPARASAE